MKRLLTLAIILATLQTAFAQYGSSILNIKASDNSSFGVVLNGRDMGAIDNVFTLSNLEPGRHFLRVYRLNKFMPNGLTMFEGQIHISPNTETFSTVLIGMNKIRMDRLVALNNAPSEPCITETGRPIPQAPQIPYYEEPNVPIGPIAMSQYDFQQLKSTLSRASFESTRLMILKQALPFNYFTTAQVRSLMSEFWFESSKLEVAKAAYGKTIDQQNYYLVNNEFSFGSSVRELGEYLAMN